ncbi:MAG: host attachment protein [Marinobacter sp.]|uniref:host attachment protein n=1 Tax=Marinobacter sp. TaxID=50741 RepID=UPI00299D82A2|nr:host attachment protein [Marinobacter sp.]MDX1754619.1 host attachment protein [Marinobacter sp.]
MTTWVLVADSARARFLQTESPARELKEMQVLVNPSARLKEQDLVADAPGSHGDGAMPGRHRMPQRQDAKSKARKTFAKEIDHQLNTAFGQGQFDKLCLVAAPNFLGELRSGLSKEVRQRISGELSRDITTLNVTDIYAALKPFL